MAEAQARIARNIKLPSGYRMIWAGEFEDLQEAKDRLELIVPVSLVLIIGLLYCLFNSMQECLLTLVGIPFAVAGGIVALYISGLAFSVSAAIGFVSLFGVSVMNGILLITYYNQAKLRGLEPAESMYHAASTRMRPLLMTSLSACIGLLPAVIVGGMLVGPVMLLVVVPALMILGRRGAPPQPKAQSA